MDNCPQNMFAPQNQGQTSSSKTTNGSSRKTVTRQGIFGRNDHQLQKFSVQIVPQIIRDNNVENAFKVRVSESDSIRRLKQIVEEKEPRYAADIQDLSYDQTWLEDNNTVGSYGIRKGSKIFLRMKIRLNVLDGYGSTTEVIVYDTITLNDLKNKFRSIMSNPRLLCDQLSLDDENPDTPLWAIGIGDNDEITVY